MTNIDYDFSDVEIVVDAESLQGFRITKCCGNCKSFWYSKQKERRGFCKSRGPAPPKDMYSEQLRDYAEANWSRTHTTCVCDRHRMRAMRYSIGKVGEWTNKTFGLDGVPTE